MASDAPQPLHFIAFFPLFDLSGREPVKIFDVFFSWHSPVLRYDLVEEFNDIDF
jgi:hypothetical protein